MRTTRWARALAIAAAVGLCLQIFAPLTGPTQATGQWLVICSDGVLKQILVTTPAGSGEDAAGDVCADCIGCPVVALGGPAAAGRGIAFAAPAGADAGATDDNRRTIRRAMADPGPSRAPPRHL